MIGTVTTTFAGSVEQRYLKLLADHVEAERNVLGAGQIGNMEQYKWHAGIKYGLEKAQELLQQAVTDVQRSEGQLRRSA